MLSNEEAKKAEDKKALENLLQVVSHEHYREIEFLLHDHIASFKTNRDNARNWDEFVSNRAVVDYIQSHLLHLRDKVVESLENLEDPLEAEDADL